MKHWMWAGDIWYGDITNISMNSTRNIVYKYRDYTHDDCANL